MIEGIILFWRICHLDILTDTYFDRYRNISLSLKNVMFVVCNVQLVLSGVFCGNQSNCRIVELCILIGECWNGVDSLEILELVELPGRLEGQQPDKFRMKLHKSYSVVNKVGTLSGMPLEGLAAGMPGMSLEGLVGHMDGF